MKRLFENWRKFLQESDEVRDAILVVDFRRYGESTVDAIMWALEGAEDYAWEQESWVGTHQEPDFSFGQEEVPDFIDGRLYIYDTGKRTKKAIGDLIWRLTRQFPDLNDTYYEDYVRDNPGADFDDAEKAFKRLMKSVEKAAGKLQAIKDKLEDYESRGIEEYNK